MKNEIYKLTYILRIGNGPEKGSYPLTAGFTPFKERAETHKAEGGGNDFEIVAYTDLFDIHDLT